MGIKRTSSGKTRNSIAGTVPRRWNGLGSSGLLSRWVTEMGREITNCPFCGNELEMDDRGFSPSYECEAHGEMQMEVWGHSPNFWHTE